MGTQEIVKRINKSLSLWVYEVETNNAASLFDNNNFAEYQLIPVLNLAYDINLQNANEIFGSNYPSVDLVDTANRIAFQVTVTSDAAKITHTLKKFTENKLDKEYDKLYVVVIQNKLPKYKNSFSELLPPGFSFDVKRNVVGVPDIINRLKKVTTSKRLAQLEELADLLEKEFGKNEKTPVKDDEADLPAAETLRLSLNEETAFFSIASADDEVEFLIEFLLKNKSAYNLDQLLTIEIDGETSRINQIKELSGKKDLESRKAIFDAKRELEAFSLLRTMLFFKLRFLLEVESALLGVARLENYLEILKTVVGFHSLNYNKGIYSGLPDTRELIKLEVYTKEYTADVDLSGRLYEETIEFTASVYLTSAELQGIHKKNAPKLGYAEFYNLLRTPHFWHLLNFFDEQIEINKLIPALIEAAWDYSQKYKDRNGFLFYHCNQLSKYYVGQG